ncbi:MAG: HPr(Ser) kinase/phosphatase [Firmicutes bacterium]|nr:HPr(Ser) kinase/phosphatase [Bacillota bacterium]
MLIDETKMVEALRLTTIVPTKKKELLFESSDQNRPGLQFSGHFEFFANNRMQILGMAEISFLDTLDAETRKERLAKYFSFEMPCLILCRGLTCAEDMASLARRHNVPVYGTQAYTTRFQAMAILYLNRQLAPHATIHGTLIDVHGVGVLITGESGVGKSESALELVKRGHQLVADDVVEVVRVSENRLTGEAPAMVRYFMEIRGIGIIDIRAMFGIGAVTQSKTIDLVIDLEHWVKEREYDRLGMVEEMTEILDVNIPRILLPVKPGRNLAIVIEVAARNFQLRRLGYNAAVALDNRLTELARGGI